MNAPPRDVAFEVSCAETNWGDSLVITGASSKLGRWDPFKGIALTTDEKSYPIWRASSAHGTSHADVEWKIVILRAGASGSASQPEWEPLASNRTLSKSLLWDPRDGCELRITCEWATEKASYMRLVPQREARREVRREARREARPPKPIARPGPVITDVPLVACKSAPPSYSRDFTFQGTGHGVAERPGEPYPVSTEAEAEMRQGVSRPPVRASAVADMPWATPWTARTASSTSAWSRLVEPPDIKSYDETSSMGSSPATNASTSSPWLSEVPPQYLDSAAGGAAMQGPPSLTLPSVYLSKVGALPLTAGVLASRAVVASSDSVFDYEAELAPPAACDDEASDDPRHPRNVFYASPNRGDPLCPIASCGEASWPSTPGSSTRGAAAWEVES